jgi:hypothetical protein
LNRVAEAVLGYLTVVAGSAAAGKAAANNPEETTKNTAPRSSRLNVIRTWVR